MVIEASLMNVQNRVDADRMFLADIEASSPEECRAIIREYYPGVETIVVEGDQVGDKKREKQPSEQDLREAARFGAILYQFRLLYHEWECDGWGWIVDNGGHRSLVLSSHGQFYFAEIKELEARLSLYREIVAETEKAIALLQEVVP